MHTRALLTACVLAVLLQSPAHAQEVRDREANQQGRIAQGIKSGQITAHGAATLESREAAINATRRADLAAHGGHLTPAEYHRLNEREDSLSRQIHTDKHNDIAQPGVVPH